MGRVYLRKYGEATTINFDLFIPTGVDFKTDAVHASGDTKIMKDEGAEGNTTNGFTDEGQGYSIALTATELQAARVVIYVVDQGTKAWLDTSLVIETYGNASAQHAFDLDTATVASNVTQWNGTNVATPDTAGYPKVTIKSGTGAGEISVTAGIVAANLMQILGTLLTETAGYLAAGFKKFFNVLNGTGTINSIPDALPGAANGLFIAGTNAATTITSSTGSALTLSSTGSNGHGLKAFGNGTGDGINATGGATGNGIDAIGGATSGGGLKATASGASNYGIEASGTGATDSGGIKAFATVAGEGIEGIAAGNGHGIYIQGSGAGEGIHSVGGSGTTGDGALFASGGNASAAGIRITGGSGGKGINVDTLTMSGAAVITGGLTTNITGTITTATNLTNAPTNGDFTAVMKTSLNTATPTVTVPAADIRNAIGMASANLDTQLTGINTNTTNATSPLATAASIAALENISSTDVENAVDKVINTNAHAELTSIPAANAPLGAKIELNAMAARNGGKATASSVEINKDNGVALGTATLTKTSTSFTRGKLA